jgi:hypothetical protein
MRRALPQYLYKYRPVDANALAMLASDKLYLSRLDAFNDPFEALNLDPILEPKLAAYHDGKFAISEQPSQVQATGASLRACSLSEECHDLLMWGHYADRHCGFCIRFEFNKDPELSKLLFPVDYAPSLPPNDAEQKHPLEKAIQDILKKSEKWNYEREWRIIGQVPEDDPNAAELFASYKPDAISGIIFGVRTPELHKALIREILHDHRLQYFQVEKQRDEFALKIQALDAD